MPNYYEMRLVVGFEETNVVGNVYFVNHLRWQGRCRELFIKEKCPELLTEIANGLYLATLHCSCDYFAELNAFDEIAVRMSLGSVKQNRIAMKFEYVRLKNGSEERVAFGEQEIACFKRENGQMEATPVPSALLAALEPYA